MFKIACLKNCLPEKYNFLQLLSQRGHFEKHLTYSSDSSKSSKSSEELSKSSVISLIGFS